MNIYAEAKMQRAVKLARMSSRDSWQCMSPRTRKEMRMVSREAMQDARYWKLVGTYPIVFAGALSS